MIMQNLYSLSWHQTEKTCKITSNLRHANQKTNVLIGDILKIERILVLNSCCECCLVTCFKSSGIMIIIKDLQIKIIWRDCSLDHIVFLQKLIAFKAKLRL